MDVLSSAVEHRRSQQVVRQYQIGIITPRNQSKTTLPSPRRLLSSASSSSNIPSGVGGRLNRSSSRSSSWRFCLLFETSRRLTLMHARSSTNSTIPASTIRIQITLNLPRPRRLAPRARGTSCARLFHCSMLAVWLGGRRCSLSNRSKQKYKHYEYRRTPRCGGIFCRTSL